MTSASLCIIGWIALGYFAGSIPFGVVFARARGVDLRKVGSGNIGATNAARALGKRWGVVVFLCDAAKGGIPVWAASRAPCLAGSPWWVPAVGAAAFVGHLSSPWLGFRGGKGVATAFGVFAAIAPLPALAAGLVFALVYAATRLSSLGSLLAATLFVPTVWLWTGDRARVGLAAFMWALIVWKHRGNIARLLHREEGRV